MEAFHFIHCGLKQKKSHLRVYLVITILLLIAARCLNHVANGVEDTYILMADFYSCDRFGDPQGYFPMKTTVYFNITVRNLAQDSKNISIHISVLDELDVPVGFDELVSTILPDDSVQFIMSIFLPKWVHLGIAKGLASVFEEGVLSDGEITTFEIGPEDLTPPIIHIVSPRAQQYGKDSVPLVFTVNERTFWMGYSLNDRENVSISGNTTLTSLANGLYNVKVYANDTSDNMACSEEVHFEILVIHDVAVVDVKCSETEAYTGQKINITASVQNEGTATETFNVTTYANTTPIKTMIVNSLLPSNQTTLMFTWDTTSFVKGNYTVSAYAWPVSGEIDTADNTFIGSVVNIMLPPDIAVISVTSSQISVGYGYHAYINATIRNQGDHTEEFSASAYANETVIQTKTITLTRENTTVTTFIWDTTSFVKGNYTVSAYAWPVSGEIDTADNTFVDGWIVVTIPGDFNGDYIVDVYDAILLGRHLGCRQPWPHPQVDTNVDINGDGVINIFEAVILASNYGKTA